jgi:adenosylmethionine-8-amino-7-oxononanoate aminotransferase
MSPHRSPVLHRSLHDAPPIAAGGDGVHLRDSQGRRYLDAGGADASVLGHGHPHVLAALHRQIDRCACVPAAFTTEAAQALAAHLVARAPAGIGAVALVASGSEAMDSALELARQYFVEAGEPQRSVFIARCGSGHGATLGASALIDLPRVSACHEYRGRIEGQTQDEYTVTLLDELEAAFLRAGPERVIGFCAEPVTGAAGGAIPPTPGYFRGVRALCDKYGALVIADETACGMGRTGTLFAIEQDGVAPDLITLGESLSAGYQPIGAVLVNGAIAGRLRGASGALLHGRACASHPVAAAAALAVLQVIERDDLLVQVQKRGATLRRMLGEVFGGHPHVGDIRGRGLLMALELVRERAGKTPFAPALKLHAQVQQAAMQRGLLVHAGSGADGCGDHVLLLKEALDGAVKAVG